MTILQNLISNGTKIDNITSDSRKVTSGSLFVAYPGEKQDGRNFIAQAIAQGAAAVVWEKDGYTWNTQWSIPNQAITGLRYQAGVIADEFFAHPSQKLWLVGVTGTNGKTSSTHWLAQAFNALSRKTAVIGTLGNGFQSDLSEAINTTPDPIGLHAMLAEYLSQDAQSVAMEVSSHGLHQGRVNGVHFDVAVLTNLTRDHLDYHGDMASYAATKRGFFDWESLSCAVVNADDAFGHQIEQELSLQGKRVLSYGLNGGDVRGSELHFHEHGFTMQVVTPFGSDTLQVPVLGRFNVYNALAVLSVLLVSDVSLVDAVKALATLQPVAGRMQQYGGGEQPLVVVDFAHTPDALENVLNTLREQVKCKLICVFGCGGDRDAGKRPLMGEVAARLADEVVLTSDNPRSENPTAIIADIAAGISCDRYSIQLDRTIAIQEAIAAADADDIILVAGKGHENYQEIGGVKTPYSDAQVVQQALEAWAA